MRAVKELALTLNDEEAVEEGGLSDPVGGAACPTRHTAGQQTGWWRRRRMQALLSLDMLNLKGLGWGLRQVMKPRKWTLPGESCIYGC